MEVDLAGDSLRNAAQRIREADALLIFSGAGMGVDSGLGTYRGVNAGNFGMDYEEICQPKWFHSDPDLAWGFWSRCYQVYSTSTPHAGYDLLLSWGKRAGLGFFVVTSNVDGHWIRSGVGADRIWEVHGSVMHHQPLEKAAGGLSIGAEVWETDPNAMGAMQLPPWELRAGQVVDV